MKVCERCGNTFGCSPEDKAEKCWCLSMPKLKPIPAQYKDCLCPECLKAFSLEASPSTNPSDFKEGEDYYLERGLMVFTSAYHLKRGYCCGSGCRHCPYKTTV